MLKFISKLPKFGNRNVYSRFYSTSTIPSQLGKKESLYTVLGIETSCDDTCVGIVRSDGKILGEVKKPQWEHHRESGGIVPTIASKQHLLAIDKGVEDVLQISNLKMENIDAVAVTIGPGLAFSLKVGVDKAKALAKEYNKPLIPVNHLEGHCLVARMSDPSIQFPFMILLVSGGHTQILICKGVSDYTLIGNTLDDSIGEALDKGARMLGCEFGRVDDGTNVYNGIHGGEVIEILARKSSAQQSSNYIFSVPMIGSSNCDFSFSGTKSSLRRYIDSLTKNNTIPLPLQTKCDLSYAYQEITFKHLENKLKKALNWYHNSGKYRKNGTDSVFSKPPLTGLVVSGGVSKNIRLRQVLEETTQKFKLPTYYPPLNLCTDNAVMIAWAGIEMYNKGMVSKDIDKVDYIPYYPLDKEQTQIFPSNLKLKDQELRANWYKTV